MQRSDFVKTVGLSVVALIAGVPVVSMFSKTRLVLKPFVLLQHGGTYEDLKTYAIPEGTIEHHIFLGASGDVRGADRLEMIRVNDKSFCFTESEGVLKLNGRLAALQNGVRVSVGDEITIDGKDWFYQFS